jgi:hypothetical protein
MLKGREEEAKLKRSLALKSSHQESEEEEENDDDKETTLLTKRFKKFMRNEKTFKNKYHKKEVPTGESSK